MTNTSTYQNEEKGLAENLHALEDMVTRQDNMIKDLVRLIRMQNSEIDTILEVQGKQAKAQQREQRRLSEIVEKLNGSLTCFLESQSQASAAADSEDAGKQTQAKEHNSTSIAALIAKVDALDCTLSDHERTKDGSLQDQIHKLETKINCIQNQIPSNDSSHPSEAVVNGLKTEDLQTLTEALAKRQLSMQFRIDELSDAVNKQTRTLDDVKSSIQPQTGKMRPRNDPESKISKAIDSEYEMTRHNLANPHNSSEHHRRVLTNETNQNNSISALGLHDVTGRTFSSRSNEHEHDASHQNLYRQITSLINKDTKQDASLTSHAKDILNLKRRLAHAERLVGGCCRTGSFEIHGTSFYEDAAALRYTATDHSARDTFMQLYGNRLHAIYYVDMAPSAVLEAFDMIARVRCCDEMWTNSSMDVKRQIRCVAEKIVDDWMKRLPLRDDDEHGHFSARELQAQLNILKMLCQRGNIELGYTWGVEI